MCKEKVKGFSFTTLLITTRSFKTQPSIIPGQPNYETILLGEEESGRVSFDVLFTPLEDLSACLWNREREFLAGWVGIHRYTRLHQRRWHTCTPPPAPNILLSFSSTSLSELFLSLSFSIIRVLSGTEKHMTEVSHTATLWVGNE